ncbi:HNH endonuclease [Arthrobacter phage Vibaki]|uniref:HNH endonuclease n=1 Tax=Arthrobacter phage Vibaki TaxID=2593333 RepID=A0A514TZ30_9CAUD|nr:HNH endonuclease [Arthrobacter phage Vibaki]QDK01956.1 HNH endonuclease [Arthrobacter phage Vibaki]
MTRTPESLRRTIAKRTQPGPGDCLVWTGALDSDGYPKISCAPNGGQIRYAHRINWELTRGPIPDGLQLSRQPVCPNRRCIAPAHLELLPVGAAGFRVAKAPSLTYRCGHDKTPENTLDAATKPCCRTCRTEYLRAYNARRPNRRSGKKRATNQPTPLETGIAA